MDQFQQYDKSWLACMERIGRKETTYFEQTNVEYTDQIVKFNCRRQIMCWVYSVLKQNKKIIPIENLEPWVKKKMWAFVKEVCNGKTDEQKRMIEVAKTFYVLEYFINEKL